MTCSATGAAAASGRWSAGLSAAGARWTAVGWAAEAGALLRLPGVAERFEPGIGWLRWPAPAAVSRGDGAFGSAVGAGMRWAEVAPAARPPAGAPGTRGSTGSRRAAGSEPWSARGRRTTGSAGRAACVRGGPATAARESAGAFGGLPGAAARVSRPSPRARAAPSRGVPPRPAWAGGWAPRAAARFAPVAGRSASFVAWLRFPAGRPARSLRAFPLGSRRPAASSLRRRSMRSLSTRWTRS